MLIRLLIATFFILFYASCDFISPKKASHENLTIIDTIIDYHSVDVYPLLSACNNCDTHDKQNQCFEYEFVKLVNGSLVKNKLRAENYLTDTVYVDILIDKIGKISVSKIYENSEVLQEIPKFDSILHQSIDNLPNALQPALKRGIPVDVKFRLPMVITLKE
ncbi:MAG: hypothetical protein OEM04_12360 [Flavobacteriaceae bacterium]|nr:hypothetical protein [Flavobacteriaceae bacterium]